jgi:uncharacterized protein (DUF433 family)
MSTVQEREIRNRNIVKLALAGVTVPVIAEQYKLSKATISNILRKHKDEFAAEQMMQDEIIAARKRELVDQAAFHLFKHAKKAAEVVVDVMETAPDDRVRLSAAFGLLDRVGVVPRKAEEAEGGGVDTVSSELAQRMIEALESAASRPAVAMENAQFLINGNPVDLKKDERFTDYLNPMTVDAEEVEEVEDLKEVKEAKGVIVRSSE